MESVKTAALMETARRYQFSENRLIEAEQLYRQILADEPNHAYATHFLGVLAQQVNRLDIAEPLIRRSIELQPGVAGFYNNLGELLRAQNKSADAMAAFQRALTLEPNFPEPQTNIALLMVSQGRFNEALALLQKIVQTHPDHVRALHLLGGLLLEIGKPEQAKVPLARVLALQPNHAEARFLYAAASGSQTPSTAPADYVAGVFDNYADRFDEHLTGNLEYRVPQLLREALDRADPGRLLDTLDLGCGTGLTGAAIKPRARTLAGVDLSTKMVARARQRNIYNALEVGDVLPALRNRQGRLDLVVCGDVFGYIGELNEVFSATRDALRPSGSFAFTVEKTQAASGPFVLLASRRYAHSRAYIESLANTKGFQIVSVDEQPLRKEGGKGVMGFVFVLRRI